MGKIDSAEKWLRELIVRLDFVFKVGRNHPVSTDSLDDLICLDCNNDDTYLREKTTSTSWIIPTLIGLTVILKKEEGYNVLIKGIKEVYPKMCSQLWHPTNDLYHHLYFHQAQYATGETEAPITFPDSMNDYQDRMNELSGMDRYNFFKESSAVKAGLSALDFIAYRHFRTPVPPVLWYGLQKNNAR